MNSERLMAGIFCGVGGVGSLFLYAYTARTEYIVLGSNLLTAMMAFFVGEKNGSKQAAKEA